VVRGLLQNARARVVGRGVGAALLALCAASCSETTSSNAALTAGVPAASGPTLAFDSIDGPPVGIFDRLVDNLSSEAQARQVAIASRTGVANYRVRGYLAAQVIRGRTHISWVFDVYDDDKLRVLRIRGEEPGGRGGGDPWSVADEAMLRKIARSGMDRLVAFMANPGAPAVEPESGVAVADAPEPAPPRKRRAHRAQAVTAADRLALAANR
jgi:hypothetical protein